MTISAENIEQANFRGQQATHWVSSLLHQNMVITPSDDEKSIVRKIDTLKSLKEYFLKNIDADKFSNDQELINYMLFIENITEQITAYEIMIGRIDVENLRRIGRRFGQKHQM